MSDTIEEKPQESGGLQETRWPYWPVGLVLLGLVVVLLTAGFIVDRQLKPKVGSEPALVSLRPTASPLSTTPMPTPTTAASSSTPDELGIERAYLRYWELYSDALLNLDPSRLNEVAAGEELRRIEDEVANFRKSNRAVRIKVSHKYLILEITGSRAKLYDEMLNRSFTVDPFTKEPTVGPDKADSIKDIFLFEKLNDAWKVVQSVRQEG